jgi:hypothetical protein
LKGEPIRPTTRSHKLDMISTLQDLVAPLPKPSSDTLAINGGFHPASGYTVSDDARLGRAEPSDPNVHYPIETKLLLRDSFSFTSFYLNVAESSVAFSSL